MILKQYYLGCLAHASYLLGDSTTGSAVVVDPQRDVDGYIEDAAKEGLTIRHVILTHFHADFVAGHLELGARVGARLHLGAKAHADYAFEPLAEGDSLELGSLRLEVLQTPGHTPESISILVFDRESDAGRPHAVLTGDTLFIGDVGRPDLMASVGITAEELASQLYDSLHSKLLTLPDETLVYPAHGAGSMCGKNLSKETVSTIGEQRRLNLACQPMAREAFIAMVTTDQPEAPAYFPHDARLNRSRRSTLDEILKRALEPLKLDEVMRLRNSGAQLLDAREAADFEAGHLVDSVNIGLRGSYATWAGTVLDLKRLIVIIAEPGRESEAATRLGRIGYDHIAGYLDGGIDAVATRPDLVRNIERVSAAELARRLGHEQPPLVLDVRTASEVHDSRIEGSLHIPLNQLLKRHQEIPRDRKLVVHCRSGYRSAIAASLLEQQGLRELADLEGGILAWDRAHSVA